MTTKKNIPKVKNPSSSTPKKIVKRKEELSEIKSLNQDAEEVETEEEEGKAEFFRENP